MSFIATWTRWILRRYSACHTLRMTIAVLSSGIELEYDTFGSPDDPALLLVMGFTAQMTAWDVAAGRSPTTIGS